MVSGRNGFLFLLVLRIGCIYLLWNSLGIYIIILRSYHMLKLHVISRANIYLACVCWTADLITFNMVSLNFYGCQC